MGEIIWLEGGTSFVGTDRPELKMDGESPKRKTKLKPFGLGKNSVTSAEFSEFISETGYITHAQEFGWSFVFHSLAQGQAGPRPDGLSWWIAIKGADWAHPFGPNSDWRETPDHPVVHISHRDATAFAAWADARLPSEAEWEHAARGGLDARYPWGDAEPDDETVYCNIWQGKFPEENIEKDGYFATAPVSAFEPNGYGFHNMAGNVWEWTADKYKIKSLSKQAKDRNARAVKDRDFVAKGGSYLCHNSYCWRYRIAARSGFNWNSSAGHKGFRLAFDPPKN